MLHSLRYAGQPTVMDSIHFILLAQFIFTLPTPTVLYLPDPIAPPRSDIRTAPASPQATTGSVSPAPSPSHQQQQTQANRKLVCCLACERKQLAKRNPDIIMGVSEAELAQGIWIVLVCLDFDSISFSYSVDLAQTKPKFPSLQGSYQKCAIFVVVRSRVPPNAPVAGSNVFVAMQHSKLQISSLHTQLYTHVCSRFVAMSASELTHVATAFAGT